MLSDSFPDSEKSSRWIWGESVSCKSPETLQGRSCGSSPSVSLLFTFAAVSQVSSVISILDHTPKVSSVSLGDPSSGLVVWVMESCSILAILLPYNPAKSFMFLSLIKNQHKSSISKIHQAQELAMTDLWSTHHSPVVRPEFRSQKWRSILSESLVWMSLILKAIFIGLGRLEARRNSFPISAHLSPAKNCYSHSTVFSLGQLIIKTPPINPLVFIWGLHFLKLPGVCWWPYPWSHGWAQCWPLLAFVLGGISSTQPFWWV